MPYDLNVFDLVAVGPLVSILIPVFNRRQLVIEAIDSALNQDHPSFEVIVSDNCSTDGTWEECIERFQDNPRVVLWRNAENLGPVPNWLVAANLARGAYVKFLFSDDLLLPGSLKLLASNLLPGVGFVYSSCLIGETLEKAKLAYLPPLPFWANANTHRISSFIGLFLYATFPGSKIPVSPGAAIFERDFVVRSLERSISLPSSPYALLTGAGPDVRLFLDALTKYPSFVALRYPTCYFRSHVGSFSVGKHRKNVQSGYRAEFSSFYSSRPAGFFIYRLFLTLRYYLYSARSLIWAS